MRRMRVLGVIGSLVLTLGAGCGGEKHPPLGSPDNPVPVEVVMTEMAFTPSQFQFQAGQTIAFTFKNTGTVRHEAVIGDEAAQKAALEAMQAMDPSMDMSGGRGKSVLLPTHPGMGLPNVISVEPGESKTLTFQFAKATTLFMECHEVGHLEGGMKATIVISR